MLGVWVLRSPVCIIPWPHWSLALFGATAMAGLFLVPHEAAIPAFLAASAAANIVITNDHVQLYLGRPRQAELLFLVKMLRPQAA